MAVSVKPESPLTSASNPGRAREEQVFRAAKKARVVFRYQTGLGLCFLSGLGQKLIVSDNGWEGEGRTQTNQEHKV